MLDLEDFLPYQLSRLSNRISQAIANTYQDRHELNVTEWRVLAVLGRYSGIPASELAERTAMDKVAISRAVRLLLDKGLLERKDDTSDRRSKKLFLSPTGLSLYEQIAPAALAFERELIAVLTDREQEVLNRAIEKLTRAAGKRLQEKDRPASPD